MCTQGSGQVPLAIQPVSDTLITQVTQVKKPLCESEWDPPKDSVFSGPEYAAKCNPDSQALKYYSEHRFASIKAEVQAVMAIDANLAEDKRNFDLQ